MGSQRNPFLIVKDYLQRNDEQVRKNAIVALAALDSYDSAGALVDTALGDDDENVRKAAEEAIVSLGPRATERAVELIGKELASGKRSADAYALLGRLRNRDQKVRLPKLPWGKRIALAKGFSLSSRLTKQNWLERIGPPFLTAVIWGGLAGIAAVLVGNLALGMNFEAASIVRLVVIAAVVAGALAAAITLYTRPIGLHADPRAASILDLLTAGATGLVLAAVLDIIALATGNNRTLPLLILLPVGAAHMACIRLGTLGVFADFPKSARAKRMWARLLGGAAGLVVISLALWEPHLANDSLIGVAWALLGTAGFGVASAYALIDGQSNLNAVSTRAVMRPFGAFWQAAVALVGAVAAFAQLLGHQPQAASPSALSIIAGESQNPGEAQRDISVTRLPTSLPLDVKSGPVTVFLNTNSVTPFECKFNAESISGNIQVIPGPIPGQNSGQFATGTYRITLDRTDGTSRPQDLWPDLTSRVAGRTCVLTIRVSDPNHLLKAESGGATGLR